MVPVQALGSLTRRLAEPKRPHPLTRAETAEVSPQVEAGPSPAAQQHSSTVGDKLCFFSSGLEQKAASAAAGRALESKLSKLSEPGKSNSNSKQISTPLLEVRVVLSELTGRRPVPAPEKGSRTTD